MVRCSVLGCKSDSGRQDENIRFHRFPKELAMRTAWVTAVWRPNWDPTTNSRVCSKHFEEQSFYKTEKLTLLRPGSVPKLFLPVNTTHTKAKRDDIIMLSTNIIDSPRTKKMKEEINLLRKKSKEDGIKIKCLQNKIRRLLRKQGKSKEIVEVTAAIRHRSLKKRRSPYLSAEDSLSSGSTTDSVPPSPTPSQESNDVNLEIGVKIEPMDNDGDAGLSADLSDAGLEEDLIEVFKMDECEDPLKSEFATG